MPTPEPTPEGQRTAAAGFGAMFGKLSKKLLLAAGAIAMMALLLEVATRVLSKAGPRLTVVDPVIGQRYIPGCSGAVYVPEADRKVELRFNRDGFRGRDLPYDKPVEVRRVAVLGDSFVLGAGVDEADTTVALLEAALNQADVATPPSWQVMNFGVSGSSTGQELALYRGLVRHFSPDVVVCAFATINDLADNSRRLTRSAEIYFDIDEFGELFQRPMRSPKKGASEWLDRHSRFYVWQKFALQQLRFRARQGAGIVKPGRRIYADASTSEDLLHAWKLTARLVDTFAFEARELGARFLLMPIPAPEQIYDDRWRQVLLNAGDDAEHFDRTQPERRLAELAADAGAELVPLTDRFRSFAPSATLEAREEWLFFQGIGHLNEAGHRLAAEGLLEVVRVPEAE